MRREHKRYKRKEKVLAIKLSILAGVILAAIVILTYSAQVKQSTEPKKEPEKVVIETPEPCTDGNIVIYADGGVYEYRGKIGIENDGKNGQEISVILDGYMKAGFPHGIPEITEKEETEGSGEEEKEE